MSTNERVGNSDASADVGLAIHWAFSSVLITVQVCVTVYTQYHQHKLVRQGIIKFQNIGTVWEIDITLLALFLWPIVTSLAMAGNSRDVDCTTYVLFGQIMASTTTAILMYRSLLFAYRLAQIEKARIIHKQGGLEYNPTNAERDKIKEKSKFLKWTIQHLRPWRLRIGCAALWILSMGMLFSDSTNIRYFAGRDNQCAAKTSSYVAVMWYLWAVPFFFLTRKIITDDPYHIIYKLKIENIGVTVALLLFLPSVFVMEPFVGTAHNSLLHHQIFVLLYLSFWYAEGYLPLALTWKKLDDIQGAKNNHQNEKLDLVDVLCDPELLHQFEGQLIKEWAVENLEFYKSATNFNLNLIYQFKKIQGVFRKGKKREKDFEGLVRSTFRRYASRGTEIYLRFLVDNSSHQVNLPASMLAKIDEFFKDQMATAGIYLENYNSQASGSRSGFSTQFGSVSVSKAVLTSSRARGDTQQVNGHQINYHQVNGHQINGHQRDHREARTPHSYATSTGLTGLMPLNDPTNSPTASSGIASPQMGRQTNKNRSVVSTLAEPLPTEDTDLEEPQGMVAKMHLHRRDSKLESHPDIHPGFPESQPRISTHQQFGTHHHVATSSSLGPPLMSPMATTASAPGSRPASSASHGVLSLGGHGNGYGGSGNHGIVHHVGGHHGQRPSSRSVSIFTPDEKYGSGGGAGPGSGRSAHVSLKVSSSPKKRTVSARAKANKIFCRAVASAAGFTKNLTSFTFLNVPELKTGEDAHDTKQLCTQISILKGLATVFDDAKGEAFTLMNRDSFRRFARSIAKTTRTRAVTSYAKDPKEVKRLHPKEHVHDV